MLELQIEQSTFKYYQNYWKKSIVTGNIRVYDGESKDSNKR
jgi:hypothetical protein